MALAGSTLSTSRFRPLLQPPLSQPHGRLLVLVRNNRNAVTCSVKRSITAQFPDPKRVKMHIHFFVNKLEEVFRDGVKNFPWRKAESVALQKSLLIVKQTLVWISFATFIFSFVSDVVYSILRNKVLIIPFGLFIGCLISDFLKDVSQELFGNSKEARGLGRPLLSIASFFVLVKIITAYFPLRGQVLLLHAANGGLMQLLWLWRNLSGKRERHMMNDSLPEVDLTARIAED